MNRIVAPVGAIVVAGSALTGSAPAAGSCHVRAATDGQPMPDPACTPGAVDAAVTQADIATTICRTGYTKTIRPAESITEPFKLVDEKAYSVYRGELDHLVPLELGGSSDAHNLWVEPGPIPNPKDSVEDALHAAVCVGRVPLGVAQRLIATNWTTALAGAGVGAAPPAVTEPAASAAPAPAVAVSCAASMSQVHPARYSTTDALVTTAPGAFVTATAHYKTTNTSHTASADGSGHATVRFYINGATLNYPVDVDVSVSAGGKTATCSTSFTPS